MATSSTFELEEPDWPDDTPFRQRIGDTLCVNAGSEANHGILRGYLIDLTADGVERSLRVEG